MTSHRSAAWRLLASALLTCLCPSSRAQHPIARLNCGGPALTLSGLGNFAADGPYGPGSPAGYVGGHSDGPFEEVGGLGNPYAGLDTTARAGFSAYRVDLPPGDYLLRLHFTEGRDDVHGPGLAVFSLLAEGQPIVESLDVADWLGLNYGGLLVRTVKVSDGTLDIETLPGDGEAILSALEVLTSPASSATPPPVTGLLAKGGFQRGILSWDPTPDKTQSGWRVERAPSPDGPWSVLAELEAAPPRYHDDAVSNAVSYHYRVSGLALDGSAGPLSASVQATPRSSSASTLPVYEIDIDPAQLMILDADPSSNDEQPAVFRFEGIEYPVQVRYRGAGTRLAPKKSWKVVFPSGQLFQGRHELALKAYWIDDTLKRDPISNRLLESVPLATPGEHFVHLDVNGVFRGLYNSVEKVDQDFLAARDRDPATWIHRARVNALGPSNMSLLPTLEQYQASYELKLNPGAGYEQLMSFVERVNSPGVSAAELADVFDVESFLNYLAMIVWTGDVDQIQRNYYLAYDPSLARWEWIDWDHDRSLAAPDQPVDAGTSTCVECNGINVLRDTILADPGFRWRYVAKLAALSAGAASNASMASLVDSMHLAQFTEASADVEKLGWESDLLFEQGRQQINDYAAARNAFLPAALAAYQPVAPPTTLWINEFLARNTAGAVDETGAFEDWIELYDASGTPFDASGLFLSDDLSDPTAFALPPGSLVPPFGRLLVWADKDAGDGPLHAPFKLDGDGEELGLFARDGSTLLDFVAFGPQVPDLSVGRSADGGPFFIRLATPTPGAPNTTAGNLPPLITWLQHAPLTPAPGQSVDVTCQVQDDDPPLSVELRYSVDGGGTLMLSMLPLGAQRWGASIPGQNEGSSVEYEVLATDALGKSLLKPYGGPAAYSVLQPQPSGLRISEFMADNDSVLADEQGDFDDWIELINQGAASVSLAGLTLTDDLADPLKWPLPAALNLAPGERLVLFADGDPGAGPLHTSFKLSKGGEQIGLFAPGPLQLDGFSFGQQATDVSQGLLPGSAGDLNLGLLDPSPGAANLPAPGATLRTVSPGDLGALSSLPALSSPVPPNLGGLFSLQLTTASPNTPTWIVLGALPAQQALGAKGTLLVEPLANQLLALATDEAGQLVLELAVPADPLLSGLLFWLQAFTPGSGLSNGLGVTVGG